MRLRAIALVVAAGCGGSSAAPAIDAAAEYDAPRFDAMQWHDCEAAATAWREAIADLNFCAVADDCAFVGVEVRDCEAANIECGALVNAAAYAGSAAAAIEARYFEEECYGVVDCQHPSGIACVDNRCEAIHWECGLGVRRAGQVWILDVRAPGRPELGSGARIDIRYGYPGATVPPAYSDLDTSGLVPEGCETYVYAADDPRPASIDGGTISIAGTALAVPPCSFDAARGIYACVVTEGTPVIGDGIASVGGGELEVGIAAAPFSATHVGYALRVDGAVEPAADGIYPIVAFVDAAHVRVGPAAWTGTTAWEIGGSYAVLAGGGPTPASLPLFDDAAGDPITVAKQSGGQGGFPPTEVRPIGPGLELDDSSVDLDDLPVDGSELRFACSGAGGDCGADPVALTVGFVWLRTTSADVTGRLPHDMPPSTGAYAEVMCTTRYGTELVVPAAALAPALATNPRRIEARYVRVSMVPVADSAGLGTNALAAGRELIGWTTLPAP